MICRHDKGGRWIPSSEGVLLVCIACGATYNNGTWYVPKKLGDDDEEVQS